MKRITPLLITLLLLLTSCGDSTDDHNLIEIAARSVASAFVGAAPCRPLPAAEITREITWQEAYINFLSNPENLSIFQGEVYITISESPQSSELSFALRDLTRSGIPELLIFAIGPDMASGSAFDIYTFYDGLVKPLDTVFTSRARGQLSVSYNPHFPGIFFSYAHMGWVYVRYAELCDEKAVVTDVWIYDSLTETTHAQSEELYDIHRQSSSSFPTHEINEPNIHNVIYGWRPFATWQAAYTTLLHDYAQQSDNLRFLLFDIDQNGTPELLVAGNNYPDKGEIYDAVYTFCNGELISLEFDYGVSIADFALFARSGVTATPNGSPGLITYIEGPTSGFGPRSLHASHIIIDGDRLVIRAHGERRLNYTTQQVHWLINDQHISEFEFYAAFGPGSRVRRSLHPINQESIHTIIDSWLPIANWRPPMAAWQQAYIALLQDYTRRSGDLHDLAFLLFDFDQDGTPELLIAGNYPDLGGIYDAVYTFRNGELISLEFDDGVYIAGFALAARAGLAAPPDGSPGLQTYIFGPASVFGPRSLHTHIIIDGNRLVTHARGEYVNFNTEQDHWLINGQYVTEEEFLTTFERTYQARWPRPINEENIQALVDSWLPPDALWQQAFADFLRNQDYLTIFHRGVHEIITNSLPYGATLSFALRDLTYDGQPELLIFAQGADMAAGSAFDVYTFCNTYRFVRPLDSAHTSRAFGQYTVSDNPIYPGIFFGFSHMGEDFDYYAEILGEQIVVTDVHNAYGGLYNAWAWRQSTFFPTHEINEHNIRSIIFGQQPFDGWQEAYAAFMRYYSTHTIYDSRHFLHDIDGYGIPELVIGRDAVFQGRGGMWIQSIYTFADGHAMPIHIGGDFFIDFSVMHVPNDQSGMIIQSGGNFYLKTIENGILIAHETIEPENKARIPATSAGIEVRIEESVTEWRPIGWTSSWFEAYKALLHHYAHIFNNPAADFAIFALHDIDADGTPELLIGYSATYDGGPRARIWFTTIYTFADNMISRVDIGSEFFANWHNRIFAPRGGAPGIIVRSYDHIFLKTIENGILTSRETTVAGGEAPIRAYGINQPNIDRWFNWRPTTWASSWQEAYIDRLDNFAIPCICDLNPCPHRSFFLHDINGNGIPELFLVDEWFVTHYFSAYTFSQGELVPLMPLGRDFLLDFFIPPDGAPGIGIYHSRFRHISELLTLDNYWLHAEDTNMDGWQQIMPQALTEASIQNALQNWPQSSRIPVSYEAINAYQSLLIAYSQLEQSGFMEFDENMLGHSILAAQEGVLCLFMARHPLSFAFHDINGDGLPELFIGMRNGIIAIYTLQDGRPVPVIQQEGRPTLHLMVDASGRYIIQHFHMRMDHGFEYFYELDANGTLISLARLYTNGLDWDNSEDDENPPYFLAKYVNGREISITQQEYDAIINRYSARGSATMVPLPWQPILSYGSE